MRIARLETEISGNKVQAIIHRYRYVLLALYSLSLLPLLGLIAARRYFWYDELFTVLIAKLPDGIAIWDALAHGAEAHPPLPYWLAHVSLPISANAELSARIPSIFSFWLMTLFLYRIVAKETNTTYGFIAMLIPFTAQSVYFAYEARGYAELLLFASASVFFWQMAKSGERRPWSVLFFFLALTASGYSHYYGVLVYLPFILTELTVGLRKKRWDWQIWLAVLFAGIALLPLMRPILALRGAEEIFSDPSLLAVQVTYGRLFGLPCVLFGLITLSASFLGPGQPSPLSPSGSSRILASRTGTLFLMIFCLLPVAGFFLARLVTHAFSDRYVLFALVGFSPAIALISYQRWRDQPWLAVCCLFALTLMATLEVRHHYSIPAYRAENSIDAAKAFKATRHLPEGPEPLLASGIFHLPIYYYGTSEVRKRLYFLDENPTAQFSVHAKRLSAVTPLAIISLKELFEKYPKFYVYMPSPRLMNELRRLSMQASYVVDDLYYVVPTRDLNTNPGPHFRNK